MRSEAHDDSGSCGPVEGQSRSDVDSRIGVIRPVPEPDVEVRCLADYDDALGLDVEGGVA